MCSNSVSRCVLFVNISDFIQHKFFIFIILQDNHLVGKWTQ